MPGEFCVKPKKPQGLPRGIGSNCVLLRCAIGRTFVSLAVIGIDAMPNVAAFWKQIVQSDSAQKETDVLPVGTVKLVERKPPACFVTEMSDMLSYFTGLRFAG
jgi:hypothetical protein